MRYTAFDHFEVPGLDHFEAPDLGHFEVHDLDHSEVPGLDHFDVHAGRFVSGILPDQPWAQGGFKFSKKSKW